MLLADDTIREEMVKEAEIAFPDECCGFFFGKEENGKRTITATRRVDNARDGDKRRRFAIAPADYLEAERFADEKGLQLLGVYHSHPGHPAIPSEQDRVAAQPYFSYVIISVINKEWNETRSWRLNGEQQFEEEVMPDHKQ